MKLPFSRSFMVMFSTFYPVCFHGRRCIRCILQSTVFIELWFDFASFGDTHPLKYGKGLSKDGGGLVADDLSCQSDWQKNIEWINR